MSEKFRGKFLGMVRFENIGKDNQKYSLFINTREIADYEKEFSINMGVEFVEYTKYIALDDALDYKFDEDIVYELELEEYVLFEIPNQAYICRASEKSFTWLISSNEKIVLVESVPRSVTKLGREIVNVHDARDVQSSIFENDIDFGTLIIFAVIGSFGYVVLHGHRWGKDCWLCQYRGLVMVGGSITLGGYLSIN